MFRRCSSVQRMNAPRGPRSDLCVVLVTTVACGSGDGCAPRGDQPGYVRHVHHQHGADLPRDLRETREIYRPRVGRVPRHDDLGPDLPRLCRDDVVVQLLRLRIEAVGGEIVELGREVDGAAVRQVPPLVQL